MLHILRQQRHLSVKGMVLLRSCTATSNLSSGYYIVFFIDNKCLVSHSVLGFFPNITSNHRFLLYCV